MLEETFPFTTASKYTPAKELLRLEAKIKRNPTTLKVGSVSCLLILLLCAAERMQRVTPRHKEVIEHHCTTEYDLLKNITERSAVVTSFVCCVTWNSGTGTRAME